MHNYHSTALQTLIPVSADTIQTNFTAIVGDTVVMLCPVPPGALMQYYSVEWMKENNILICTNQPRDHIADPRYSIDGPLT